MKKLHLALSLVIGLSFFTFVEARPKPWLGFWSQICRAVLCENFNSFLDGSVVGQGGWTDRENGNRWLAQGLVFKEGAKALSNFNSMGESIITKNTGRALADGRQSFWVKTQNRASYVSFHSENVQLGMYQGSWDGPSRIVVAFNKNGNVNYIDARTDTRVNFGSYEDDTWNLINIEWRSADKTARYKLNNGSWTDWVPFTGGPSFTGFDAIGLDGANLGIGGVYVDNLR
ncbi:MAG: hypothetical protein AAB468_01290 [Patescibacteria group bacterium]